MLASFIAAALASQFAAADTSPATTIHCGHFIDVDKGKLLGELDIALIGGYLEAGVREPVELRADGLLHLGVQMAGIQYGDACAEVDISLAFDVPDLCIGRPVSINGQGIRDAPGNGVLAALLQVGI